MDKFGQLNRRGVVALLLAAATGAAVAQGPTIANPGFISNGRLDIAVPSSGLPFIAFQEGATAIKAITCADSACTSAASTSTIANLTSTRVRVALGADGLPVVSISIANNGLRVVKCQNATCSLSSTAILESVNLGNTDHALAIAPDGRPLIAYIDTNNGDLLFVRCGDAACSTDNKFIAIDTAATGVRAPAIALIGGLPQIAYQSGGLKLASCASLDCTVGVTFKTLTPDLPTSIAMLAGRDGAALIAYEADASVDNLKLVKCTGTACNTFTVQTLDSATLAGVGGGVQMRTGADGLPVLGYFDRQFGTVKFARCTKQDCSTTTLTTLHAPASSSIVTNGTAALAISANGTPVLAYAQLSGAGGLTVNSCNTRSCM